MEKKGSIIQPAMTYGLILSLGIILYSIVLYVMGIYQPGISIQVIQWVIFVGLIYFGQFKYRNDSKDGFISYGQSLGFGVLMGLFASIIYAFFFILLTQVIDPLYMEKLLQAMEQKMFEDNIPDEQITMIMEMSKKTMSIGMLVVGSVFSLTLISFIVSLITSIFVKKNETPFGKEEFNG